MVFLPLEPADFFDTIFCSPQYLSDSAAFSEFIKHRESINEDEFRKWSLEQVELNVKSRL